MPRPEKLKGGGILPNPSKGIAKMEQKIESAVDFSVLESICEMAGEEANLLIEEMITTYLADTEVRLQAIAEAINQADAEIIEQAAHSMKSSSANLGAVNLAQLCEELEQLGRAKKIDNTKPLLSNAQVEFQQVHQDLYSFIKTIYEPRIKTDYLTHRIT